MNDEEHFTIVSSDKQEFLVPLAAAKQNQLIAALINATQATNLRMDGERADGVPEINSTCLRRVVEFSKYHAENPDMVLAEKPKEEENVQEGEKKKIKSEGGGAAAAMVPVKRSLKPDDMSDWDKAFVSEEKLDQRSLFELILAANYLNNKDLLDVTCKGLANRIKGKSPQEIVAYFKAVYPFDAEYTPEEEEKTRKQYPWIENPNKKQVPQEAK
jgi:S-phase kinase-associated protein 1